MTKHAWSLLHSKRYLDRQEPIFKKQEQAVAALWLSEAFRVTCRSKSRAPATQRAERLPVKEQSTCHFPMWYMPMH
jgi:hypothetical protein